MFLKNMLCSYLNNMTFLLDKSWLSGDNLNDSPMLALAGLGTYRRTELRNSKLNTWLQMMSMESNQAIREHVLN